MVFELNNGSDGNPKGVEIFGRGVLRRLTRTRGRSPHPTEPHRIQELLERAALHMHEE